MISTITREERTLIQCLEEAKREGVVMFLERGTKEGGPEWKFRTILGHQYTPCGNPDRIDSDYNIQMSWETGVVGMESLSYKHALGLDKITK